MSPPGIAAHPALRPVRVRRIGVGEGNAGAAAEQSSRKAADNHELLHHAIVFATEVFVKSKGQIFLLTRSKYQGLRRRPDMMVQ